MSPIQSNIFQKAVRKFPRIFNNKRRLWNQNLAIFGKVLINFGKSDDMIVKKWWYSLDAGMVLYPKSKKNLERYLTLMILVWCMPWPPLFPPRPWCIGDEAEIGDKSWYSMSSCFTWKMASEFVDGEDIKIDEVAEVGVLGTTVATRFIIFSEFAEFFSDLV